MTKILKSGVYLLTNLNTGSRYVGASATLHNRFMEHLNGIRQGKNENKSVLQDVSKGHRFKLQPFIYCEPFELDRYEQAVIDILRPEYNHNNVFGQKTYYTKKGYSSEMKSKARENLKKFRDNLTEDQKKKIYKKISAAMTGKKYPGRKLSVETKAKISASNKGKIISEETRQKMSLARKGKSIKSHPLSEEHKQKIRDAAKHRKPISEETRKKISEANKRRFQRLGNNLLAWHKLHDNDPE